MNKNIMCNVSYHFSDIIYRKEKADSYAYSFFFTIYDRNMQLAHFILNNYSDKINLVSCTLLIFIKDSDTFKYLIENYYEYIDFTKKYFLDGSILLNISKNLKLFKYFIKHQNIVIIENLHKVSKYVIYGKNIDIVKLLFNNFYIDYTCDIFKKIIFKYPDLGVINFVSELPGNKISEWIKKKYIIDCFDNNNNYDEIYFFVTNVLLKVDNLLDENIIELILYNIPINKYIETHNIFLISNPGIVNNMNVYKLLIKLFESDSEKLDVIKYLLTIYHNMDINYDNGKILSNLCHIGDYDIINYLFETFEGIDPNLQNGYCIENLIVHNDHKKFVQFVKNYNHKINDNTWNNIMNKKHISENYKSLIKKLIS